MKIAIRPSFSASLNDLNGRNQIYLFEEFSIPCSKQFHLPPFSCLQFHSFYWRVAECAKFRIESRRAGTRNRKGTRKGVEEMEGIEEIRSLESRTNMNASSVPLGVIHRLRFLLSLSPFDPWLRNILQEQFFFLEGGNNRKRLDAFPRGPIRFEWNCVYPYKSRNYKTHFYQARVIKLLYLYRFRKILNTSHRKIF